MTANATLMLTKIDQINELYKSIEGHSKLHLAPSIKYVNIGTTMEIVQFLCTWQRKNEEVSIILNDQDNLDNLNSKDLVLLVAFYLSKEVLYGGENKKKYLLNKFIPFVENMNSPSLESYFKKIRAREVRFMCLGGSKNEYLQFFYEKNLEFKSKDPEFKSKIEILDLLNQIYQNNSLKISERYKFPSRKLEHINGIIYEIFSNTDEHGKRDIDQNKIKNSIRSLSIDIFALNKKNRDGFIKNHPHCGSFLNDKKDLLIVSIFDNGEGIVKKYVETKGISKEDKMDFSEKKQVLKDVFMKGVTSSEVPNSGMGLTYVEEGVKKLGGALLIRTGTVELFTVFNKNTDADTMKEISPCVGTLMTVFIPLSFVE